MANEAGERAARAAEAATERIRDLNEQILERIKSGGESALEAYERTLKTAPDPGDARQRGGQSGDRTRLRDPVDADAALRALLREISAEQPRSAIPPRAGPPPSIASACSGCGEKKACAFRRDGANGSSAAARVRPSPRIGCGPSGPVTSGRWTSSSIRPPTAGCSSCSTSSMSSPARRSRCTSPRRVDSDQTVSVLDRLAAVRGAPVHVRQRARADRPLAETGVASAGPRRRSSSPARRGRTPTWSPSAAACVTSCSTSSSSAASLKPSSSSKTGARAATRIVRIQRWATRLPAPLPKHG